ncbi:MAG: TetR family transcriptional regulator [Chloroflexota bacterium]|nr:TetR family transcriptional regulator [Chloroflexota bacterium]
MTTPAPRPALQQRVAGAVLDGAARVLASDGPAASMSDVAAAAGVARATVYRYFPNRQALLEELAVLALREADERLVDARLDEVPPQEALSRFVRAVVDVGDAFIVLARERTRPDDFDRILTVRLKSVFERGQAVGEIREDVPLPWLVETLLGLVVSVRSAPLPRGREDVIAAITSLFLDGARRRGPRLP